MNAAVPPSYALYHHQHGSEQPRSSQSYSPARMVKRRRLDSGDEFEDWNTYPTAAAAPSSVTAFTSNAAHSDDIGSNSHSHDSTTATIGAKSSTDVWHGSSPATQPTGLDPRSYPPSYAPQSYYSFQPSGPNTYNSPWPPTEGSPFPTQTSTYPIPTPAPSVTPAMPYFPVQSTAETAERSYITDAAVPVSSYSIGAPAPTSEYARSRTQHVSPPSQQLQPAARRNDGSASLSSMQCEDASMQMKIQSLSILENLATQLIHTIAKASFSQIKEIMRSGDGEDGQAYITLKNLFDQTRKVYSRDSPFIDAIAIQMFQPNQQEVIRKANIATFISSILGAHDVSFFHLNEFFMETFVPLGHRLLKWQGAIYLDLKTQAYISALINSDGSPQAMLDELFPADLDAQILTRHPDAPSLSPSEQDFIDRSRARKSYLLAEDNREEALRELPKKYQWPDFVKEFASCINKNVDGIMNVPAKSQPNFSGNAADRRAAAAAAALNSSSTAAQANGRGPSNSTAQPFPGETSTNTTNTEPTTTTKKSNPSTTRQPWTKSEEDALLNGLGQVNGPHWSQILALYGRGGSISEVLKDRNQVQLKDKARNLKLWYLKMGKDVPPALRGVTGELRKRGGARARAALGMVEDDEGGEGDGDVDVEDLAGNGRGRGRGKEKRR